MNPRLTNSSPKLTTPLGLRSEGVMHSGKLEKGDAVMITANDIKAEHEAAMAGFTPEQRRALSRLEQARRQQPFNNRSQNENLFSIFEAEASQRNDLAWRAA
jgi:hypothetical protein